MAQCIQHFKFYIAQIHRVDKALTILRSPEAHSAGALNAIQAGALRDRLAFTGGVGLQSFSACFYPVSQRQFIIKAVWRCCGAERV
jgi:hypothetical protein